MAINDVLGLTVEVSATTDKFIKDLQDAARAADLDLDVKDSLYKSFKGAHAGIKGIFAKTVAEAATAGLGKARIDKLIGKLRPMTDDIENSMKRIFEHEVKIRKGGLNAAEKKQTEELLEREKIMLQGLHSRIKIESVAAEKIIKRRKALVVEAERLAARTMSEAGEEFGESIGKAFADVKSGNLAGLLKGAGKRAGATGANLQEKGAAKGGMYGGALKGIGGLLTMMGPLIMGIGAIAAGFAALVAVVISADSAVKDLNKTIVTSGVSGADLADQYGRLGNTMNQISQGFMESFAFNRIWGTTAKDHLEILGAYANAGVTFREMTSGITDAGKQMEVLKQYTVSALTYSKLLGLSTAEVSEAMGAYMSDLGFTLDGIVAKFSNITAAAKESGFSTKRFFNMVLQATSGMSMYNVRLEEAAGLLMTLGKVLGEKMGGDFLQQLAKGFKDEDTTTRIVKSMTTGVGLELSILKKDAMRTSEEFVGKLGDLAKTNTEAAGKFDTVLTEFNLKGLDADGMLNKLSTMGDADRKDLLAKATAVNPAMGRMLSDLSRQSIVMGPNAGRAEAQAGREGAGMGASLLLQMNELMAVTGKRIDQISDKDEVGRIAFEKMTGKSGAEYRKLAEVAKNFSGRDIGLTKAQKNIRALKASGDETGAENAAKAFNATYGKEFGVILGEQGDKLGQRFVAKLDQGGELDTYMSEAGQAIGDTFDDLVLTTGQSLVSADSQGVSEDILLAQEIASNTTDMAKVLEQGVEWLLSKIYDKILYISGFFGAENLDKTEKMAKGLAMGDIQDKYNEVRKQEQLNERAIKDLEREKIRPNTSAERKEEINTKIKGHQATIKKLQDRGEVYASAREDLGSMTDEDILKYRVGDRKLSREEMIGVGAAGPKTKALIKAKVDAGGGAANKERMDAGGAVSEHVKKAAAATLWSFSPDAQDTLDEEGPLAEQARDKVLQKQASDLLGIAPAVAGVDTSWNTLGVSDKDAVSGVSTSTKEFLKDQYIDTKQDNEDLSKKELTEAEKQNKALATKIIEGIKKNEQEGEDRKLASAMAAAGVAGGEDSLVAQAKNFRATGAIPSNIKNMGAMIKDPETGLPISMGDYLRKAEGANATVQEAITNQVKGGEPPTKDFLMHIGSDGQVKFSQRIDGADQVTAVATKGGGGLDSAMRRGGGGGGGITIVQHNYSDMEAIKKGYRSMMAARALG